MIWSTDRYKKYFKKSTITTTKFHDKVVQSSILWLNLNKTDKYLTIDRKTREPLISHSCTGLKTQIPMHSNSIGCPKILSPVCSSFVLVIASDRHLEHESEKRAKNVDINAAKICLDTITLFRYY